MVCDPAFAAEQIAGRAPGERPAGFERDILAASHGAPWADIPARYGPYTTCVNRFNRWRKASIWGMILSAVSKAYKGDIQMIDSSSIRVHQHAANGKKNTSDPVAWVAREGG